jgi:zinc/manganese transport system substrate-binding protein
MKQLFRIILAIAIVGIAIGTAYTTSRYILNQPANGTPNCTSQMPYTMSQTRQNQPVLTATTTLQIVAAENFWGSLISQLVGTRGQVLSIVSDPNADPHDYETNAADATAIANADYVIVNGAGYDQWALNLIAANNNNQNRKVLNVADLLGKQAGDNPHFWYSPTHVNQTIHKMYSDLVSIDVGAPTSYYTQQYANLNVSLGAYNNRVYEIRQSFAGTRVAATENIFQYLADATHLNLISPPEFMKAVAEGNDPSPADVITFRTQLMSWKAPGNASVLVYNLQTVTPLTQSMKCAAASHNIPIVGVTETVQPSDVPFQDWMNAELISLQNALNQQALAK